MNVPLDWTDRQLLAELVHEHRAGVKSGDISGYEGTQEGYLTHLDELLGKLEND